MSTAIRLRPACFEDWQRRIDAGEIVELIDGEIVPQDCGRAEHGLPQAKIAEVLGPFNRRAGGPRGPGGWWIFTEVDIRYPQHDEVFRHDASGYRREGREVMPSSFPLLEVPDWACEILSASTARIDLVKKRRTLHQHGVPYYWVVDPANQVLTVHRLTSDGYVVLASGGVGDRILAEPFGAVEIDVGELFGHDPSE